jgi:hypothetical protein
VLDDPAQILRHDLDPEFIKSLSITTGWEYAEGYRTLEEDEYLSETLKNEEFGRRRGGFAIRALAKSATKHGIPYNFRRLDCNGQDKILVKAGRVIIIQECILSTSDHPQTAEYKRELADAHGLIRQLELELGDQPRRISDWSGCILAALLHAPAGPKFTKSDRTLGALMLAVPDAAYRNWTVRLDLHRIAMYGFPPIEATSDERAPIQRDQVVVTPKKRNAATGTDE